MVASEPHYIATNTFTADPAWPSNSFLPHHLTFSTSILLILYRQFVVVAEELNRIRRLHVWFMEHMLLVSHHSICSPISHLMAFSS